MSVPPPPLLYLRSVDRSTFRFTSLCERLLYGLSLIRDAEIYTAFQLGSRLPLIQAPFSRKHDC
jgi:hypothetical protein